MHDPLERERRALALFREVADMPSDQQQARLASEGAAVAKRVRALLHADAQEDILDKPVLQGAALVLAHDLAAHDAATLQVEVPEAVGPWRVRKLLGAGGMGIVYEADQEHPRRQVALKVLRPELRRRLAIQFRAEADALATLVHPGIPQVYETGQSEEGPWMAMEKVDGVALDRWADAARPSERLTVLIAVCEALGFIHARGHVHRDIKPSNILITPEGQPKIMDFGLAVTQAQSDVAHRAGTPGWMSPEARAGTQQALAPASDVYALGRIADEILRDLPWPISQDLPSVVHKATHTDPQSRYADGAALASDLRRLQRSQPVTSRSNVWWYRLSRFSWRNRAVGRSLAAMCAVAGLSSIAWYGYSQWISNTLEVEASQRLEAVQPSVARLLEDGDIQQARELLQAVALDPRLRTTRAVPRAWLEHADRLLDVGADAEARIALGEAFLAQGATAEVLRSVARAQLRWHNPAPMGVTLDRLDAIGEPEPAMRAQWAALVRDLDLAASVDPTSPMVPVLRALAPATSTPWQAWRAWPVSIDGTRLVYLPNQEQNELVLARPTAALDVWAKAPLPDDLVWGGNLPKLATGGSAALARGKDGTIHELDLSCSAPGAFCASTLRTHEGLGAILSATQHENTLYVGTGWPKRALHAWTEDTQTHPAPDIDGAISDVNDIVFDDIDDDGIDEMIVSVGPWRSFDVRVLERSGDRWSTRARHMLGESPDVAVATLGGERRILALHADRYASPEVFGPQQPFGPEAGLYVLADGGDHLDVVHHVPMPPMLRGTPSVMYVGDFDNDGNDDVAAVVSTDIPSCWLLAGRADGSFDTTVLRGVVPIGVAQLDDDENDELIVRLPHPAHRTWVLGAGTERLPTSRLASAVMPKLATRSQPSRRVLALANGGLPEEAAALARRLASTATDERAELEAWAGEVLLSRGVLTEGATALEAAAHATRDPAAKRIAMIRAADAYRTNHDPSNEQRMLSMVQPTSSDVTARITASKVRSAGLSWEQGAPWPSGWQLDQAAGVDLHPVGTMGVSVIGGSEVIVSHPVTWDGDFLSMELELLDLRAEFGSGVSIALVQEERTLASATVRIGGGGGESHLIGTCTGEAIAQDTYGEGDSLGSFEPAGPVHLKVSVDRIQGTTQCIIVHRHDHVIVRYTGPSRPMQGGPARVVIRGSSPPSTCAIAHVASVRTRGVKPTPSEAAPHARSLAIGHSSRAYEQAVRANEHVDAAVAAIRMADPARATEHLQHLSEDVPLPPAIVLELRRDTATTAQALASIRGPRLGQDMLEAMGITFDEPHIGLLPLLLHPAVEASRVQTDKDLTNWTRHMLALADLGQLDAAERAALRILNDPDRPDSEQMPTIALTMARVAASRGDVVGAKQWLDKAEHMTSDPDLLRRDARRYGLVDEPTPPPSAPSAGQSGAMPGRGQNAPPR